MTWEIKHGDAIDVLSGMKSESVDCCLCSPPYWKLVDYGSNGQYGQEKDFDSYLYKIVTVFDHVKRILKKKGVLWLNLGDTYKNKQLIGVPWRVAFAMKDHNWVLRSEVIYSKLGVRPESVRDRPSKSHETLFLFSKSKRYYYDIDSIREPHIEESLDRQKRDRGSKHKYSGDTPLGSKQGIDQSLEKSCHPLGRNQRTVWEFASDNIKDAHFAVMPLEMAERCVLSGTPRGGIVIDPFAGTGTTGVAAIRHGRNFVGIEINEKFIDIAKKRMVYETERIGKATLEDANMVDKCQLGLFSEIK